MKYFYFNGKILPENKVQISPFDAGFLRAYGVFEVLRTYNLKPVELDKHLERLLINAKILKIHHSYNKNKIKKAVFEIISKVGKANGRLFPKTETVTSVPTMNFSIIIIGSYVKALLIPSSSSSS